MTNGSTWDRHKYKVFLSYSHADLVFVDRVENSLKSFETGKSIRGIWTSLGPVPSNLRPIFRDRSNLSASVDLAEELKESLDASACLVVICSPSAANSKWVDQEIRHFISQGKSNRIFPLIISGDPQAQDESNCFPLALRERDPAGVDARPHEQGGLGFDSAILKIAAACLGVDPGLLLDSENQRLATRAREARRIAIGFGTAALASIAFGAFGIFQALEARRNLEVARGAIADVMDIISDDRFATLPGIEPQLELIITELLPYQKTLLQRGGGVEARKAIAISQLQQGRLHSRTGNQTDALTAHEAAYATSALLPLAPDGDASIADLVLDIAGRYAWLLIADGRNEEAENVIAETAARFEDAGLEIEDVRFASGAATYLNTLGRLLRTTDRDEEALATMERMERLARSALRVEPDNTDFAVVLFLSLANQGVDLRALGKQDLADQKERIGCEGLVTTSQTPADRHQLFRHLTWCIVNDARTDSSAGRFDDARRKLNELLPQLRSHLELSPEHLEIRERVADALAALGTTYAYDSREFTDLNRQAVDTYLEILDNNPVAINDSFRFETAVVAWAKGIGTLDLSTDQQVESLIRAHNVIRNASDELPNIREYALVAGYLAAEAARLMRASVSSREQALPENERKELEVAREATAARRIELLVRATDYLGRIHSAEKMPATLEESYEYLCAAYSALGRAYGDAKRIDDAIGAYNEARRLATAYLEVYPFDFYVRQHQLGADYNSGVLLLRNGRQTESVHYLKAAANWGGREAAELLVELYEKGALNFPKDQAAANEMKEKLKTLGGMKRFTVPVRFAGRSHPFQFYVLDWPVEYPFMGIDDQIKWLKEARGGEVSDDVRNSFIKLHKIARQNNVAFTELTAYAIGAASEERR